MFKAFTHGEGGFLGMTILGFEEVLRKILRDYVSVIQLECDMHLVRGYFS